MDSIRAHTRPAFTGEAATPILPRIPFCGMPWLRVMSVQVSPPSVDFQIPLPGPPLLSDQKVRCASQVVA